MWRQKLLNRRGRENKFNSKRTEIKGRSFSSKLEAAVYMLLKEMESAGHIENLKCQVKIYLTDSEIGMIPDFSYEQNGELIYCEAKGVETPEWQIKKKLWRCYGPGKLVIYKGGYKNPKISETIVPKKVPDQV